MHLWRTRNIMMMMDTSVFADLCNVPSQHSNDMLSCVVTCTWNKTELRLWLCFIPRKLKCTDSSTCPVLCHTQQYKLHIASLNCICGKSPHQQQCNDGNTNDTLAEQMDVPVMTTDQLPSLHRQYFRHIHLISYSVLHRISNWIRYKRRLCWNK